MHCTAVLPSNPEFDSRHSQEFVSIWLLRLIDGTAENTGQRLDNVNRTHLVLASGKLVVQKNYIFYFMKKPVFSEVLHKNNISLGPEMLSTGEKMFIGGDIDSLIKKSNNLLIEPVNLQQLYKS